ncbi:MAG: hypothetical protein NC204_05510 [Candidatus Amulumruptor caecigallinarius]|nr:hypothetical protein [Candidatus Amulumruptor caecigallinarius]
MKHAIIYTIILLSILGLTSCSDDNDGPDVDITIAYDNVVEEGSRIYVVEGTPLIIKGIYVESANGSAAAISGVNYYWNYCNVGFSNTAPFSFNFDTSYLRPGNYILGMKFNVLQVDKSIAVASIVQNVTVVASAEDLPGELPGESTQNFHTHTSL